MSKQPKDTSAGQLLKVPKQFKDFHCDAHFPRSIDTLYLRSLCWKGLVDWTTITVNLTPVGSHQNVIVKRYDEEKIYLQSNGGLPIDCFYHVYAERQDCERNIAEYEGKSPQDYPGDNTQYLQSGKV